MMIRWIKGPGQRRPDYTERWQHEKLLVLLLLLCDNYKSTCAAKPLTGLGIYQHDKITLIIWLNRRLDIQLVV